MKVSNFGVICRRQKSSVFVVMVFFLVLSMPAFSGIRWGIPDIHHFNRRDYAAGTQNWKIDQAPNGLIYFANNEGILEYDGVYWRKYAPEADILYRSVHCNGNRVFISGFNQMGVLNSNAPHALNYLPIKGLRDSANFEDFWTILSIGNQQIFHSHKAICVVEEDSVVSVIPSEQRIVNVFKANEMVLVQIEKRGLMELRNNRFYPVSGGLIFADKHISSILALSSGKLLIGTMNHGLYVWDMVEFTTWDCPANGLLKESNIFSGTIYDKDVLVFGTIQRGLVIVSHEGEVLMILDKDKGLKNNTVLSVFVDKEKNIWAGLDNGIAKVEFTSGMSFMQGYYDIGTGYAMERRDGIFYMGTNQGLYAISEEHMYSPEKHRLHFRRIPQSNGQIWTIRNIGGVLLVGHNQGAFEVVEDQSLRWITPSAVRGVWGFRPIGDNKIVAGTYNGLILLEKQHGKWIYICKIEGFDESSRYMEWDADGGLWVSHGSRGLFKVFFTGDYKKVRKLLKYSAFSSMVGKGVTVSKISDRVVFSTKKGLFYLDAAVNQFKSLNYINKLFEHGVYPNAIVPDRFQNIWFFSNSNAGVLRRQDDGTFKRVEAPFYPLSGKLVNGFEFVYVLDQQNALFGVEDGYAHYQKVNDYDFQQKFNVHIRSFRSVSDSVSYDVSGVGRHVLERRFPYKNNSFEVTYAATFFSDEGVLYSTYLEGLDAEYSSWSKESKREWSKLREGSYVFWVKAKNMYGVESEPVGLSFEIMPPLYRGFYAWLFYVLVSFVILFLIVWFSKRRLQRIRMEDALKQQIQFENERVRLNHKSQEAEAALIRMKNESLVVEMNHKEKELANTTLHLVKKNEFLTGVKDSLKKLESDFHKDNYIRSLNKVISSIDREIEGDNQWSLFEVHFDEVHRQFLARLKTKHPDLTPRELKLCAYVRMGMTSKEIAALMNLTPHAIENNRYKLRSKIGMQQRENFADYILSL